MRLNVLLLSCAVDGEAYDRKGGWNQTATSEQRVLTPFFYFLFFLFSFPLYFPRPRFSAESRILKFHDEL
jgi:hypothetical protein